jgi:hypothetical protein
MTRLLCNTENYGGGEAHTADRSHFDWTTIGGVVVWACDDCRYELGDTDD